MHIPIFKMPTITHVWQLIQQGDYALSIDLKDVYLYNPTVKHHSFFMFCLATQPLSVEGFAILVGHSPYGFCFNY